MIDRRRFLHAAGTATLAAELISVWPPLAMAQAPTGALRFLEAVLQDGTHFDPAIVTEAARLLAGRNFVPPNTALPEPFQGLTGDAYRSIEHRPERRIWSDESVGYQIEPLHRGSIYTTPVLISVVESGVVRRIVYNTSRYTFGKLPAPPATIPDIGFSGFKLIGTEGGDSEIASFQGATFFRSHAKGQRAGAIARALAIKTGDPRGEEFPVFRAFWIERPEANGPVLMHAIADSESATAAFRFTLRPGDMTIIDTEVTVFARAVIDHLGLGPVQGTYLFGPSRRRAVDDLRPQVHDVHGLHMRNGRGEWIWRPLNNPEQLQISSFMDENPKAFGLVQRDRDFASYHDDDNRFDLRPTVWVEPIGDWGEGSVQLTEIPSDSEVNDNVIAYWRPKAVLAAGSQTSFAYRQYWCWVPPERPDLAQVVAFRVGKGSTGRRRRCLAEFAGDLFGSEGLPDVLIALSATPGQIMGQRLVINAARKTARVTFELDPNNEAACELRLVLVAGEKPLTETLLYRWTQ